MINQNSPPNSLINVIQKKYNSFNGVISNKILFSFLMKDEKGEQTFLILIKVSILEYVVSYYLCC